MFKIKRFMTFFGAAMLLILTSCEFGSLEKREASGSVVVDLSSVKDRITSSSRTAYKELLSSDFETFADLKLEGDFETSQTINLNETEIVQIDNIPVGSKITASIEIYINIDLQDEGRSFKETKWHGTSEVYEITDGPNEIIIPLSRGGNEEIIDEPEEEDKSIKIYVKWAEDKQGLSTWDIIYGPYQDPDPILLPTEEDKDGKTSDTAFNYIQSAVEWIIENGNANDDYTIILTDYDDTRKFNQGVVFKNSLNSHMNSVTLTCDNPDVPPFTVDGSTAIVALTSDIKEVILKNIKISKTSAVIEVGATDNTYTPLVTLADGALLYGAEGVTGSAIIIYKGTAQMTGTSNITGFTSNGAVSIKKGRFEMHGDSTIDHCGGSEGGAIYSYDNNAILFYDNASITDCEATDGGAIYLRRGSFTMYDNSSITSCKATNSGGAIYMNTESSDTEVYLRGGKIKTCRAPYGAAIFRRKDDTGKTTILEISEDFDIDPDEIYRQS